MTQSEAIQGVVQIEAHIGENGLVEQARPVAGNPVLLIAAIAAIRTWKFTPFTVEGKPARAIADLSFTFTM